MRSRVQAAAARPLLQEPEEITRFSSFTRLTRVTAWCFRWLRLVKKSRPNIDAPHHTAFPGSLSATELDEARRSLIRVVQAANWASELKSITQGKDIAKGSSLKKLTPFIDPQGILSRRTAEALPSGLRSEAPGDPAAPLTPNQAPRRKLPPTDSAWRSAADTRLHPPTLLDTSRSGFGQVRIASLRLLCAMASGNASPADG